MKLLSTFIKELKALEEAHGDLPVITYNCKCEFYSGNVDYDESESMFGKGCAWDARGYECDCIVIR